MIAGMSLVSASDGFCQSAVISENIQAVSSRSGAPGRSFRAVADGNSASAAVTCDGKLMISTNGVGWDEVNLNFSTFFRGVTCGNGLFIAVGGSFVDEPGVILTSRDSKSWIRRAAGNRVNLYSVAYGGGSFVAVGDADTILTSRDGASWTRRPAPTWDILLAAVAYGNGVYVAVGDSGTILTSRNGVAWFRRRSNTTAYLQDVVYDNGQFVVIGSDGLNWISSDEMSWRPRTPVTPAAVLEIIPTAAEL